MSSNYPPSQDLCEKPVEKDGTPTTYLSFRILRLLWRKRDRYVSVEDVKSSTLTWNGDVNGILQGLKGLDFVSESTSEPGHYRYNLSCSNIDLQIGFEKFLNEVETGKRPNFDLRMDYSPSYRTLAINGIRF